MHKIVTVFLAAAVLALSLSGCSEENLTPPVDTPSPSSVTTTTTVPQDTNNVSTTTESSSTTTTQPQITPPQQSLMNEQTKIAQSNELMGVAYLGYCEGSYAQVRDYLENQSYSSDCLYLDLVTREQFVAAEGAELYVVIPLNNDIIITVNEYAWMDENGEYAPSAGKELITINDGRPILLQCNISDIMSNLQITAEDGKGKSVSYNPCLSLEDGMLDMLSGGICDLTPYEKMPQFNAFDPVPDSVFCGTWFSESRDGNNDIHTMILTLEPDGGVKYSYGIGNSEILESFTGTWSDDGTMLTLDMTGGPVSAEGADFIGNTYNTTVYLEWHMIADGLELTHVAGGVLLYGTENETFVFTSLY